MLTEEQIKKYIEGGGVSCPHCGSQDIEGGFVEIVSGEAWQDVTCNHCGKKWTDIYKLKSIEEE